MKKKNLAFTLAEVLIVIGIIGVVAALTLPNLNHATGDKETVTRLKKAYSVLSEAQDRMVAIYGPMSSWSEECRNGANGSVYEMNTCWMSKIKEFLKVSKFCDNGISISCDIDRDTVGDFSYALNGGMIELKDGITFSQAGGSGDCRDTTENSNYAVQDICLPDLYIDVNGLNKGKNEYGKDIFKFQVSDSIGLIPMNGNITACMRYKDYDCTWWVLDNGNLDYLKTDNSGKCNDSDIILDGTTNTSCH